MTNEWNIFSTHGINHFIGVFIMSIASQASNHTTANSHESAPSCSEGAFKNNDKLKEPTKSYQTAQ